MVPEDLQFNQVPAAGLARQPHSAILERDFRAHMAALRQSRSFPDLPVGRPAEVPRKARAHRLRSLAPSVREHLRPHDEAIDSAVERLDRTLTEEEASTARDAAVAAAAEKLGAEQRR